MKIPLKCARHVALVSKPAVRCYFVERKTRLCKKILRALEASLDDIEMGRTTETEFKLAQEVIDTDVRDLRKLSKA